MDVIKPKARSARYEAASPDVGSEPAPLGRLRGFHPGWFGAVMGTAIIGVAASLNPGGIASLAPPARTLGQVMAVIAAVLAAVLAVSYLGRFVLHRDAALADLRDPVAGALYGTLPGGILVLAATAAAIGPTWFAPSTVRSLVAGLDWVGVPLAFLISVVFAYLLFVRSELVPETVNGGWFIPPVVNIVVPLVLMPLVPGSSPAVARALLLASYGFFGMGFLLYLLILTMLHHRLVLHPLPHAGLAPSLWIGLGPIGVGALALVKMAGVGTAVFGSAGPTVSLMSKLAATALWGFGVWWLAAAALLLVHYLRAGPLPFGIGWWGFTFPLGAYTVATLTLAKAWNLSGLDWAGAALFVLLGAFWLVVSARTLRAVGTGEAWRGVLAGSNSPTADPVSRATVDGGAALGPPGPALAGLDGADNPSGMEDHHGQAR
jgi:C4-dicarboxylate transporter/malic acid transport protein